MNTKFTNKKNIITYHRITKEKSNDPLSVCIKTFENQIKFLKDNFKIVPINSMLNKDFSDDHQISVTFDDGYKDNLLNAVPILEKYNAPAIIYITTRFLEKKCEMWWYELQLFIENNNEINFIYMDKSYKFKLISPKEKIKSFKKISLLFKKLKYKEQNDLLQIITSNIKRTQFNELLLNKDDLLRLKNSKLITLGGHTHNHLSLKHLKEHEILEELKTSKKIIEEIIGKKIDHFAYPYGTKNDVGKREMKLVEKSGFLSAVTTQVNIFETFQNFFLPRIYINERDDKNILLFKLSFIYRFYYFLRFKLFNFD